MRLANSSVTNRDSRYLDLGQTGCTRADGTHRGALQAADDRVRQPHRVHFKRHPGLGRRILGGVALHHIVPGRPMQNGYVESFSGRMRDELLNESLFIDLDQARQLIGSWVVDYNTARPHSLLGYKPPTAYAGTLIAPKGVILAEALTAAG
jgi:transposase InsO family protein